MLCAAAEQPLGGQLDDASLFGGQQAFDEAVRALRAEEKLVLLPGGPHHAPSWRADVLNGTAAELCNIRSIERHKVQVLLRRRVRNAQPTLAQCAARGGGEAARSGAGAGAGSGGGAADAGDKEEEEEEAAEEEEVVIDEVERWRVYYEFFPGAVYLNQGRTYVTQSLDLKADGGTVRVAAAHLKYYTAALDSTQVHVLQRLSETRLQVDSGGGGDGGGGDDSGGGGGGGDGGGGGGEGSGSGDDGGGGDCGDGDGDGGSDDDDDIWESAELAAVPPPATQLAGACAHLGRVRVTLQTEGFCKIWHKTGEIFEEVHAPLAATARLPDNPNPTLTLTLTLTRCPSRCHRTFMRRAPAGSTCPLAAPTRLPRRGWESSLRRECMPPHTRCSPCCRCTSRVSRVTWVASVTRCARPPS